MNRRTGVIVCIIFCATTCILVARWMTSQAPAPRSEAAAKALAQAERIIPALEEYYARHGRYPCFLSELNTSLELDSFTQPPGYQATATGYHLLIQNPGGTNMIHYNHPKRWLACSASDSCPPNHFAVACCNQPKYPACDSFRHGG